MFKKSGLSSKEVEELQNKYGRNVIEEPTQSDTMRFLKKFLSPIPIMIEVALLLSVIAGKWEDFIIIGLLLAVNIFVDFWQEHKARNALEALKQTLTPYAMVLRDGEFASIDARDLVPGDVIKLVIGDIVPADALLVGDNHLEIDQSAITGESLSVDKKEGDTLYASSIVQEGSAVAQVTAIGFATYIGKSASLVVQAEQEEVSHFQKAIFGIGKFLIILSSVLIIIVLIVLITRGDSTMESLQFALVLAIASIPVALPAVLSVTMAIGATDLAKEDAIISDFESLEELAGVDMLCIDKTGTLTKNELTVSEPKMYEGFSESDLFTYAYLASEKDNKKAIESAIESYAHEQKLINDIDSYSVEKFNPFNPTRKTVEATVRAGDEHYTIIMGAPQVVASKISSEKVSQSLSRDIKILADDGLRSLAVAKTVADKTILVGLIPLFDPPRDDSVSVMKSVRKYGVHIKMLTGDNKAIAQFITHMLKLGKVIVGAKQLHRTSGSDAPNYDSVLIEETDVFAEVVPEDKYHIVDALQRQGHLVAMTGDGVNDAPALKKADIGIAVSGASPAARSAADIVLLASGLATIKSAIEHARMIFSRMQSYATFRIAETIRIVFFITFSVLIFNYSPLSAVMIILLALLNDIPVMSIAYDNAQISERPIRWHLRETIFISTVLGIAGLISSFGLFYWLNVSGYGIAIIQSIMFLKLDVSGHSTLYLTRTGRKHFWQRPFPSLKFFIPAFSSRIIGTIIVLSGILMEPLGWRTIVLIWVYSTIWFLLNDQVKVAAYKILDRFSKSKDIKV